MIKTYLARQGSANTGSQVIRAAKFCTAAPNTFGIVILVLTCRSVDDFLWTEYKTPHDVEVSQVIPKLLAVGVKLFTRRSSGA